MLNIWYSAILDESVICNSFHTINIQMGSTIKTRRM